MWSADRAHRWLRRTASGAVVLEAVAVYLLVTVELAVLPTARLLSPDAPLRSPPRPPDAEATMERLRRLVDGCLGRPPLRGRCLARALVLRRMLGRRGLPSQLVISVRTDAGRLAAHAETRLAAPDEAAGSLALEIRP